MQVPVDPEEKAAWIKYQLNKKNLSYSAIARQENVSRETPRRALYRSYPRMEKVIAEALGMTPEEIWPERY